MASRQNASVAAGNSSTWSAFFTRGIGSTSNAARLQSPKVYVHFFPMAIGVSAPYPIHAFIEVFAGGRILAKQGFEGLRINQPDGLDLADVFPMLFSGGKTSGAQSAPGDSPVMSTEEFSRRSTDSSSEEAAPVSSAVLLSRESELGISIQLRSAQPRIDLSRSRIMIEICYPSHRLRYHAVRVGGEGASRDFRAPEEQAVYAHDTFETRLVEIRPGGDISIQPAQAEGEATPIGASSSLGMRDLRLSSIEKRHSPLPSGFVQKGEFESAGRLPKALPEEEGTEGPDDDLVRFLVQYEPTSSLPVSVRCL